MGIVRLGNATLADAVSRHPDSPVDVLRSAGIGSPEVCWSHVLRRDPCSYCGRRLPFGEMTVDHIVAFSRGEFAAGPANGAGSCRTCNEAKGASTLLEVLSGIRLHRPLPKGRVARKKKRRTAAVTLEIYLSKNARSVATRELGACPDDRWWRAVAERISARTLQARNLCPTSVGEEGWWIVPVTSVDDVDVDLHILVMARRNAADAAERVYILGLRLGSTEARRDG